MAPVLDCDQHLMEPPTMWADYADPADRHRALRLAPDDLGHWWLWHGERRLELVFRQLPGDTAAIGHQVSAVRAGEPARYGIDELHPPEYTDPAVRLQVLDDQGFDGAAVFPNYGLGFEQPLSDDLDDLLTNMRSWNRYAVDVVAATGGRLRPVGHLSLRDPGWAETELASLAAGGVRGAMIGPALVDGRRLSHPDHERIWAAFADHGIAPVMHVSAFPKPFGAGWYEDDPDPFNPVLSSVFLGTAPALALADLAVHGVLARHPDLRIGVMELSAIWVPMFLLQLDGGFDFHATFNGAPLTDLELRPSEYIARQVRVAAFSYEGPSRLMARSGDLYMACSDYPHSEGTATARADYERAGLTPADAPALFGGNLAWLFRLD